MTASTTLMDFIRVIEDPRIERNKKHKLSDILMSALLAIMAGCEGWLSIYTFVKDNEESLRKFLDFENGIPSHDTYARVISILRPEILCESLYGRVHALFEVSKKKGNQLCLDGKDIRRSFDKIRGKDVISLVSAWCVEQNLVLGQVKVGEKSNEITAVPELLKILNLQGMVVSLDAIHCHQEVAKVIHDQQGDWLLALESNQRNFHHKVKTRFEHAQKIQFKDHVHDFAEFTSKGHGRIEIRKYWQMPADSFSEAKDWPGLRTIGCVEAIREIQGKTSKETRYYLSSLSLNAGQFGQHVRNHWTIENNLHWCLDVSMGEDASRLRTENAAENFATLRRIALSLHNRDLSGLSLKAKQRKANSNPAYLTEIIKTTGPGVESDCGVIWHKDCTN